MTTFVDEEMKAWRHASFMEELGLMGYSSYQEYLDEQAEEAAKAAEEYCDFNESREF